MKYHIGLDGTDSPEGGCTTWTFSRILDKLYDEEPDIQFLDYPRLIRLNPNIPYKTRGNGALYISIDTELSLRKLSQIVVDQIIHDQELYETEDKPPGLIVTTNKPTSKFYHKALTELVILDELYNEPDFNPIFKWPDKSISHIGAYAAIAADLSEDHSYELIAYRKVINCGKPRVIDKNKVIEIDTTYPYTFSSFDHIEGRELIAPSGPDPVFYGIRSENAKTLVDIKDEFVTVEPTDSFTIFKSNQGTNVHVREPKWHLMEYSVISFQVIIVDYPTEIRGGHVFVRASLLSNPTMILPKQENYVKLAFFEPTKKMRDVSRQLIPGDRIFIHGSVHKEQSENNNDWTIHIEYFSIIDAPEEKIRRPPMCSCGKRMKSSGIYKGYKCKNCSSVAYKPEIETKKRDLFTGQKVYASKSAQRHLTKPQERLHQTNKIDRNTKLSIDYHDFRFKS